jgi:hypothetical protein
VPVPGAILRSVSCLIMGRSVNSVPPAFSGPYGPCRDDSLRGRDDLRFNGLTPAKRLRLRHRNP